jgi:hypothetical protein
MEAEMRGDRRYGAGFEMGGRRHTLRKVGGLYKLEKQGDRSWFEKEPALKIPMLAQEN